MADISGLSYDEAIEELKATPATREALIALVNKVSVYSSGSTTVLFSGSVGNASATTVAAEISNQDANVRHIGKTDAFRFLDSRAFIEKVGQIFGGVFEKMY